MKEGFLLFAVPKERGTHPIYLYTVLQRCYAEPSRTFEKRSVFPMSFYTRPGCIIIRTHWNCTFIYFIHMRQFLSFTPLTLGHYKICLLSCRHTEQYVPGEFLLSAATSLNRDCHFKSPEDLTHFNCNFFGVTGLIIFSYKGKTGMV